MPRTESDHRNRWRLSKTEAEKKKKEIKEDIDAIDAIKTQAEKDQKTINTTIKNIQTNPALKELARDKPDGQVAMLLSVMENAKVSDVDANTYQFNATFAPKAAFLRLGQKTGVSTEPAQLGRDTDTTVVKDAALLEKSLKAMQANAEAESKKPVDDKEKKEDALKRQVDQAAFFLFTAIIGLQDDEPTASKNIARANAMLKLTKDAKQVDTLVKDALKDLYDTDLSKPFRAGDGKHHTLSVENADAEWKIKDKVE